MGADRSRRKIGEDRREKNKRFGEKYYKGAREEVKVKEDVKN